MTNKLHFENDYAVTTSVPKIDPSVEPNIVSDSIKIIVTTTAPMMGPHTSRFFSFLQVTRGNITRTYFM